MHSHQNVIGRAKEVLKHPIELSNSYSIQTPWIVTISNFEHLFVQNNVPSASNIDRKKIPQGGDSLIKDMGIKDACG